MLVTIFRCPQCKTQLPYNKAFLENGNMTVVCPQCSSHNVIEADVKCSLCSKPAEHLTMKIQTTATDGTTVYGKELRCHLHEGCDDIQNDNNNANPKTSSVFNCYNCHMTTRYSKAALTVVDGTLHAVCPGCNADCSLQQHVKCQYSNCGKPATYCKPQKSMCAGYALLCDEHKDMKVSGCFIATAACGSEMAGDVMLLRKYRDTVLRNSQSGRRFIKIYEASSPPIARVIAASEALKRIVRMFVIRPATLIAKTILKKHRL